MSTPPYMPAAHVVTPTWPRTCQSPSSKRDARRSHLLHLPSSTSTPASYDLDLRLPSTASTQPLVASTYGYQMPAAVASSFTYQAPPPSRPIPTPTFSYQAPLPQPPPAQQPWTRPTALTTPLPLPSAGQAWSHTFAPHHLCPCTLRMPLPRFLILALKVAPSTLRGHHLHEGLATPAYVTNGKAIIRDDHVHLPNGQPVPNDSTNRGINVSIDNRLTAQFSDQQTPQHPPPTHPLAQRW
jgi:hypothetical protein